MKQRVRARRRKWSNQFYKVETAGALTVTSAEFERCDPELALRFARTSLDKQLSFFIKSNALAEVGARTYERSTLQQWDDMYAHRAFVRAKRPYRVQHLRCSQ